jgi:hypothetical protein
MLSADRCGGTYSLSGVVLTIGSANLPSPTLIEEAQAHRSASSGDTGSVLLRSDPTWRRVPSRHYTPQRDDARRVDSDRRAACALGQPSQPHDRATRGCQDRGRDLLKRSLDLEALPGDQSHLGGIQAIKTSLVGRRNGDLGTDAKPARQQAVGVGPGDRSERRELRP